VCLGTSSTYGHGFLAQERADYPAQLDDLLHSALSDRDVEVLNAAVPGSTVSRVFPFFRDVLCAYRPDILILCLGFNDATVLSQSNERAYYEKISSVDFENSLFIRLKERIALRWRQQQFLKNRELFRLGQEDQIERGKGERFAPKVFASVLFEYLAECKKRGIRLLLVKEPIQTGSYMVKELHEAMTRLADDESVPLLDPVPALQRAGGVKRFLDIVHPDRQGHAVIASELARVLLEENML
jgi:lysophospholipase L1-like esterase